MFRRVDAHCTTGSHSHCPGGYDANGNSDDTKCDGAPVYQRVGEGGGVDGGGPVLFRFYYDGSRTAWFVGPSARLADCYGNYISDYLSLGSNRGPTGGAPTAPEYSAGDGSYDYDTNPWARGTISVSAGDGGGGGGGH